MTPIFNVNRKTIGISAVVFSLLLIYFIIAGFSSGSPASDTHPQLPNGSMLELRFANKPGANSIVIEKAVLCLDVKNRNPVTELTRFTADTGNIYCWVKVLNGDGQKIRFIWKTGANIAPSRWLEINSNRFRVWCPKNIDPRNSGEGTVDIVDGTGRLLKRLEFEVIRPKKTHYNVRFS